MHELELKKKKRKAIELSRIRNKQLVTTAARLLRVSIKNYQKEAERAYKPIQKQGRKRKDMDIVRSILLRYSTPRKDQYALVKRGKDKGERRRFMIMSYKNAYNLELSKQPTLPLTLTLKRFRKAASRINFITKFCPYKTRLHCEACYSFDSMLASAGLDSADLRKEVDGLAGTLTQGELLKLPKIWIEHERRVKNHVHI